MDHLFPSYVDQRRLTKTAVGGRATFTWTTVARRQRCRLDLNFIRLGKEAPREVEAGRAPDRVGTAFGFSSHGWRSGDRLVCVEGPVTGTFEVQANPDVAVGFAEGHHVEVGIKEVAQSLAGAPT